MMSSQLSFIVICAGLLLLTFFVYSPGLSGDFEFDDGPNIIENHALQIHDLSLKSLRQAAASGNSGPLGRPISMVSFALNYYFTGTDPFFFKLTNIGIHLLTGTALAWFTLLLLRAYQRLHQPKLNASQIKWAALLIAGAWLLHPLNLTSVLYIVQRMTTLATLFMALGLIFYLIARIKLYNGDKGAWPIFLCSLPMGILACLSKETGVLLPFFILTIELTVFRFRTIRRSEQLLLYAFFTAFALLPILSGALTIITDPDWLISRYQVRNFNLEERLLTESRVIWFYLSLILFPTVSKMGLYHDDIIISSTLFSPPTTIIAIIGLLGLALVAVITHKKAPMIFFGIVWFAVGHSLESSFLPLEIVHEHRNYLPMFGILLAIIYYATTPFQLVKSTLFRRITVTCFIGLLGLTTYVRADQWGNLVDHAAIEVNYHPTSMRANYQMGRVFYMLYTKDQNEDYLIKSKEYLHKATELSDHDHGALFALIHIAIRAGEHPDKNTLDTLHYRLRHLPSAPNTLRFFKSHVDCLINQLCQWNNDQTASLYTALIKNPHNNSTTLMHARSQLAFYFAEVTKELNNAYTLLNQTVNDNPNNIELRLNLISLLYRMNRYNDALKEIEITKQYDHFNSHKERLENYHRHIRDAMNNPKNAITQTSHTNSNAPTN